VATNVSSITAGEYKKKHFLAHIAQIGWGRHYSRELGLYTTCKMTFNLCSASLCTLPPSSRTKKLLHKPIDSNTFSHHRREEQDIFWQDHIILEKSQAKRNSKTAHSKTKFQFEHWK
jgi:hypothetical protein